MKDLFFKDESDRLLFNTVLDDKNKEDASEAVRRIVQWRGDLVRTFCETDHGRRVLWLLVHETYVYRSFGQHNASAYALEGKRELGLALVNLLGAENVLKSLIAVKNEASAAEGGV